MLGRVLASSRYVVVLAVLGPLLGSLTLIVYEPVVIVRSVVEALRDRSSSPTAAKTLAVGLIESVDVY